jgi:hypothetical protein
VHLLHTPPHTSPIQELSRHSQAILYYSFTNTCSAATRYDALRKVLVWDVMDSKKPIVPAQRYPRSSGNCNVKRIEWHEEARIGI